MSRVKLENRKLLKTVGQRISFILEKKLKLSLPQAAPLLGYENPATLYKSRAGGTMLHPEKLEELRLLFKKRLGKELDLHWVLTGKGDLFYEVRDIQKNTSDDDIIKFIAGLSDSQKAAIRTLILG